MGETTAAIALEHPENDYLAVEVHTPGVGSLLKLIGEQSLANIRIVQHDALEVLKGLRRYGSARELMLVGHEPDMGRLASQLLTGSAGLAARGRVVD